ncbi:MAG: ATP synthase F1 subunit delta [Actinomycetota bacterium]
MAFSDDAVRGYAEAFAAVADAEGVLDKVEDELFAFGKALEKQPELREALTDASIPSENRKAVVRDVLSDRAHDVTVQLIGFAVESGHAKDLGKIVEAVSSIAAARRDHQLAEVRSAVPLDDALRARLAEALSTATGRSIEVKVVVDPSVVGGVVAQVGNEVFDGSIASRLDDAKQQLGSV